MLLATGSYLARSPEGCMDTRGSNNTPFMVVTLDVCHVAAAGQWQELTTPVQRSLWLATTDAAWPYTEKKLRALGFNGDFRAPEFTIPVDNGDEGWVQLICDHETYEGQTREKWGLAKWGDQERTPPADDVMRRLKAKWEQDGQQYSESPAAPVPPDMPRNTRAPQAPPQAPAPGARQAAPAAPPPDQAPPPTEDPTGDDIPF